MTDIEDSTSDSSLRIDVPMGLLPDLSEWGIEELDKGVCEDTYENRRALRENKARWQPVYTQDGHPTHMLQVISSEMNQAMLMANKSALLSDDRNPDSDYLTGWSLVLNEAAEKLVPAWIIAASRKWEEVAEEREHRKIEGNPKEYRPALASAPGRCNATRVDGHRCQSWHGGRKDENGMCRTHLASQPNREDNKGVQAVAKARNRVQAAAVAAIEQMEDLMNTATSEPVRLGAAKEILDRAGIRGGIEIENKVEVTVKPARDVVQERLDDMRKKALEREEAILRHAEEQAAIEAAKQAADTSIIDVESEELTVVVPVEESE